MFALKPISHDNVVGALAKAERYRLLNEPSEAESICHDILQIEPSNQAALINLILALTDQIPQDTRAFADAIARSLLLSPSKCNDTGHGTGNWTIDACAKCCRRIRTTGYDLSDHEYQSKVRQNGRTHEYAERQ
jgi:hypothetical protein